MAEKVLIVKAAVITAALLILSISAAVPNTAYWRGGEELEPGPFLCLAPAATGVTVVCDRWPDGSDLRQFGLDAIRLSNAQSETDKAIAVWRWIRRWTMYTNETIPTEKRTQDAWSLANNGYIQDPIKVMNVYGAHWCDGLARIMEGVWRALGYRAEKVYRSGHTMVHCRYTDTDSVARWHLFDVSEGRFKFDRTRTRILGADGLGCEVNHWSPVWIHCDHLPYPRHRMELALRTGEKLERLWRNLGKPYENNIHYTHQTVPVSERGPYGRGDCRVDYGNGQWTYSPDLSREDWQEGLAEPPCHIASKGLMSDTVGRWAEVAWHFRTPYIISNAAVIVKYTRRQAADSLRLLLSTDGGNTYKPLWTASKKGDDRSDTLAICPVYPVPGNMPPAFKSPFGLYAYRLKLKLKVAQHLSDCEVKAFRFSTTVQLNLFSLPQLQPGLNTITVQGELAPGKALQITYVWDDSMGKERRNVTRVEKTPYTYTIAVAGKQWNDARCRSLSVEGVAANGRGNRAISKEYPRMLGSMLPLTRAETTRDRWMEKALSPERTTDVLLADLRDSARTLQALEYLIDRSDSGTFAVVESLCCADIRSPVKEKGVIALYLMSPEKARAVLQRLVSQAEGVCFAATSQWLKTTVIIGHQAVQQGWKGFSKGLTAACLSDSADQGQRWALLRLLAQVGDVSAAPAARRFITDPDWDTRILAAGAAGSTGDTSLLPLLCTFYRAAVDSGFKLGQIAALHSLGRFRDESSRPLFEIALTSSDENLRAAGAEALVRFQDNVSQSLLNKALLSEPFQWVRDRIEKGR
ncbi:MAG: hypothetical protein A2293_04600 [Elusimicrobia bacterium RIFOXYB2_FULL_49_7]|nr:MAG: hypothetical protein A2293_04600 [Elusimicrobia bacterium RIFOXYB2_FULL_49_7]